MQQPQRLSLRFAMTGQPPVDLGDVIPVFHRWIQDGKTDAMLIDVADYRHVQAGPGIVMVGHADDFGIDNGVQAGAEGQGFYYVRKHARLRDTQPFPVRLREIWTRALAAAHELEQEEGLRVQVDPARVRLVVLDRLRYPFAPESLRAAQGALRAFFAEAYGTDDFVLDHPSPDARLPMTWRVAGPQGASLDALRTRAAA